MPISPDSNSHPDSSAETSRSKAVRPWILGALFVWALTGAVAFAAYSSRETATPKIDLVPDEAAISSAALSQNAGASKAGADSKSIVWEPTFEGAMQRARAENKPIFIDFYTDWCSVCKSLDREVLPAEAVVSESRNWVAIKINAEKRPDVAGAYGVSAYPTLVFAEKSGKPLSILPGFAPAPEFVSIMQEARGKIKSS